MHKINVNILHHSLIRFNSLNDVDIRPCNQERKTKSIKMWLTWNRRF